MVGNLGSLLGFVGGTGVSILVVYRFWLATKDDFIQLFNPLLDLQIFFELLVVPYFWIGVALLLLGFWMRNRYDNGDTKTVTNNSKSAIIAYSLLVVTVVVWGYMYSKQKATIDDLKATVGQKDRLISYLNSKPATVVQEPPKAQAVATSHVPSQNIVVENSKADAGDYGQIVHVTGELRNNGDADAKFINANVTLYDGQGKVEASGFGFVGDVIAGGTKSFDVQVILKQPHPGEWKNFKVTTGN